MRAGLPQRGRGDSDALGSRTVIETEGDEWRIGFDTADGLARKREAAGVGQPEQPITEQHQDQQAGCDPGADALQMLD